MAIKLIAIDMDGTLLDGDSNIPDDFWPLLDELRAAKGFTQLMVSHDLGMVFHHATHVICLKRHVFAEGTPDEVLTPENLMALFGMHMGLISPHALLEAQKKEDCHA